MPDGIPHAREELLARYDAPRLLREHGEEIELLRGEVEDGPVELRATPRPVDEQPARFQARLHAATAAHCTDARAELPHGEGLHDVVIGTELEAHHTIGFVAACGDDDDGHFARGTHFPQDVEPVIIREAEVEEHDVRLTRGRDRLGCIDDVLNFESVST